MSEKCRELGVPFLDIGMNQFDKRYMSPEEGDTTPKIHALSGDQTAEPVVVSHLKKRKA